MCLKQTPRRKRVHCAARTSHPRNDKKTTTTESACSRATEYTHRYGLSMDLSLNIFSSLLPSLNVALAGSLLSSFLSLFLIPLLIYRRSCLSFPLSRHRFFSCWNISSCSPLSFGLSEGSALFTFPYFLFLLKCNIRSVTFFVRYCRPSCPFEWEIQLNLSFSWPGLVVSLMGVRSAAELPLQGLL